MRIYYFNTSPSDDLELRIQTIISICYAANILELNRIFDRESLLDNLNRCEEPTFFFIHITNASPQSLLNDLNIWPENAFAIFYGGEGIYGVTSPHQNIKILSAWFPAHVRIDTPRFRKIVRAVGAAGNGLVEDYTNVNINL